DLPVHRLRVVAPDVGGGFGVKSALYPEEVAVCALARLTGRPVQWVADRREDLLTSTQAWDETIEAELAVNADGTIRGLRDRVVADVGAYSSHPWTATRQVRQRIRFIRWPYRVVWDSGSFVESLERARDAAGYEHVRAEQERARRAGRYVGVGVACYVELTGVGSAIPASPGAAISTGTEGATVRVDPGGTVTATFGLACHGQGHETTLAQVVAEELGARLEDVRVVSGDTAAGPVGTGTYASRSAVIGGGAAILAARALREKALAIAAHLLEVSADDLTLGDGRATVRGTPHRGLTLREIAGAAYAGAKRLPKGMEPGLEATRFYDPYFGTAS